MAIPESIEMNRIFQALRQFRHNISVSNTFTGQMKQIKALLCNDQSGLVSTMLDFMVNTSSVPIHIETENDTLDANLEEWQDFILNSGINVDIPRGLRELSTEYFRERWTTSFIGLKIIWETKTINGEKWEIPAKMFFVDGESLRVDQDKDKIGRLDGKKYTLGEKKEKLVTSDEKQSVIIRKPYNAWYSLYPTPFLVRRGILFNALLKKAIVDKQADIMTQIIPYLLLIKSGNDILAKENNLAGEPEMKKLKESLIEAVKEFDMTGELGKLIASLNYDVNMEHFIPDFGKFMDIKITHACDKNILAGFGMIEVQGFAKNREETMLNPKVMVEEIHDGVQDWADILKEVMIQMMERNKATHKKLTLNKIKVVPGLIKAFLTEDMKIAIRNAYDRGNVSRQSYVENTLDLNFKLEIDRLTKEKKQGLDKKCYPPVIQNMEQYGNADDQQPVPQKDEQNLEDQGKKPGTPEVKNFNKASKIVCEGCGESMLYTDLKEVSMGACACEYCGTAIDQTGKDVEKKASKVSIMAPYKNIDELPPLVKDHLPPGAQIIFVKVVNKALKEGKPDGDSFKEAWHSVKKSYYKDDDGKWKKRK